MPKARYYQPQAIKPHTRVSHKAADTYCDQYVGELKDLVEACVLQPHMAPSHTSVTWRPEGVLKAEDEYVHHVPGYLTVTKRPDGLYRVTVSVSREERAARRAQAQQRDAERRQRVEASHATENDKKEAEWAKVRLSSLNASHEQFRANYAAAVLRSVQSDVGIYNKHCCDDGYTMTEETLAEFFESLEEALDVLRYGTSVFSPRHRAARIAELRSKLAKGDAEFKPFLAKLLEAVS